MDSPVEHLPAPMAGTPREVQDMLAERLPAAEEDERVIAFAIPRADAELLKFIAKVSAGVIEIMVDRSKTPAERDLLVEWMADPTEKRDCWAQWELLARWMAASTTAMTPATPHLLIEAAMGKQARAAVLASGDWLTAAQIADIAGLSSTNPSAQPNKWKRAGQIFAIRHGGTDLFPGYGLDPDTSYRPRKELADIIKVFAGHKSGWGMAFWFLSDNSFLGGRRPQDVLAPDPAQVIAAAADEIQPITHG